MNENVTSNNSLHTYQRCALLPRPDRPPHRRRPDRHSEPRIPPIPKPHNPESTAPAKTSRCTRSTTFPGKLPTRAFDQCAPGFFRLLIVQNGAEPPESNELTGTHSRSLFPTQRLRLVMHLRRHMKRRLALAHPPIAVPFDRLLAEISMSMMTLNSPPAATCSRIFCRGVIR